MHDALTLLIALAVCAAGMGWFALSMETHWQQVRGRTPLSFAMSRLLRVLGTVALAVSLALCLKVDSASIAVLVWVMAVAGAALAVAFTLSWRARMLGVLVFWAAAAPR